MIAQRDQIDPSSQTMGGHFTLPTMVSIWVRRILGFLFSALCACGGEHPSVRIPLSGNRSCEVFIVAPESETGEARTTLILWHGGGWTSGEAALLIPHAEALAEAGYLCFVPEYPLVSPENSLEQCVEDARAITIGILSDRGTAPIDRDAVYFLGESAGGHLAAMLASDPSIGPCAGLVLWNPVLDLRTLPWLDASWGGPQPDRAALSPITRLGPDHPPTLILHGAEDAVVSVEQAVNWCRQAEALGVGCRLMILPETGHAFALDADGPGRREALRRTLNFLRMPKSTIDRTADTPFHIVHAFSPETGWQPFTELTLDRDADIAWGATHTGGPTGRGTLFRVDLAHETLEVMHAFAEDEGSEPFTGNLLTNDAVFGITKFGGAGKGGTLYRLTPSNGRYETLANFGPNEPVVAWGPHAGPIMVDDYLWGTAFHGGPTRWGGALYRLPRTGGPIELMQGFSAETGEHPTAQLLLHEGWIYGTLSDYGKSDPRRAGTLFRIRPDGTQFEVIHRFSGGGLGAHPYGRLVAHPSGLLLGTTFGRFGDPHDRGTLFAWDPATRHFTTLADFNLLPRAGGKPNGSAAFDEAGESLFFTTHGHLEPPDAFPGVALRVRLTPGPPATLDRIEILHTFSGDRSGRTPMRSPLLWGGKLWGLTAFGHNAEAKVDDQAQTGGLLYRLDPPPPLEDAIEGPNANRKGLWIWLAIGLITVATFVSIFLLRRR